MKSMKFLIQNIVSIGNHYLKFDGTVEHFVYGKLFVLTDESVLNTLIAGNLKLKHN